jgi:hypothetical protein
MKTSLFHFALLMVVGVLILGTITIGRSQPRLQTAFRNGIDSLRLKGIPHQVLDEMVKRNGHQEAPSPLRQVVSPQLQTFIIDTAIVYSLGSGYPEQDTMRHLYSHNVNGKMTLETKQAWKGNLWVDNERHTSVYDATNNLLSRVCESSDAGGWVNSGRETWTYDAANNMLSHTHENWTNGQWVNFWREGYTYDANGHRLTELYANWADGQWVNASGWMYSYDVNGNRLTELWVLWLSGQWTNYSRITYTYDANGKRLSWGYDNWSGAQWVNSDRGTYTNDAQGKVLADVGEHWLDGHWVNSSRFTYTYDSIGNRLSELIEYWSQGQWANSWHQTYIFDTQGNLVAWSNYRWSDSSWTLANIPGSKAGVVTFYDSSGNSYSYLDCCSLILKYRAVATGVADEGGYDAVAYSLSQNYPNPFNPSTTITFELPKSAVVRLSVYDMLGREVSVLVNERRDAGVHEVKFEASALSSGVYFYRLQAGDFTHTKRLLLLR